MFTIPKLSSNDILLMYAQMLHVRIFEETCALLYTSKDIAGFCHLYTGQEAVAVGIQNILQAGDNTISAYRVHGHALLARMLQEKWLSYNQSNIAQAIDTFIEDTTQAQSTLAELMGRQNGGSKGKGGSMHLFDAEYNFYGGHGIVGIQIPLGAGLAFADKYKGKPNVTFASLGDGAMNQGQVYEAFNMAQLWNLPIIFVLENNGYAIGTSKTRSSGAKPLYERAKGFGIESHLVDGMNILEVVAAAKYARAYALEHGPIFLEMNTYRYRPHSMSDPGTYRTKDEVNNIKQTRDPIEFIKEHLIKEHNISTEMLAEYEMKEKARMKEVVEYCQQSPLPGEEELSSDIFVTAL